MPDQNFMPEVANGHVGTKLYGGAIYMNGLYNGKGTDSHRARIPSTVSVSVDSVTGFPDLKKSYTLNVVEGRSF